MHFCIRNIKQDFINYSSDIERTIHNLEIIRLILQHLTSPYFLPRVSKNKQYDFSNNQAVEKFNLNSKFCELCWQPTIRSEEIKKFNQKNTNDHIPLMRSINLSNRYCKDHNPADNKSKYRKDLRYKSAFIHEVFGKDRKVRFRPHYFPFTEPSAEVDVSCNICNGKGCRVCSGSGWLEILGAGMVDPNLYSYVNYNAQEVNGFAFGMGIERICMLKYGINDIRLFYENDIRFLEQF